MERLPMSKSATLNPFTVILWLNKDVGHQFSGDRRSFTVLVCNYNVTVLEAREKPVPGLCDNFQG